MPNKNGTGPEGKGPRTGRGLGNCSERAVRGNGESRGQGQGQGQGRGMGMRRKVDSSKDNS